MEIGDFMSKITLRLSEEETSLLKSQAEAEGISMQECIRKQLFNTEPPFSIKETVSRALQLEDGSIFTLPFLYKDKPFINGYAGVFGKKFKKYILSGAEPNISVFNSSSEDPSIWTRYILNKC